MEKSVVIQVLERSGSQREVMAPVGEPLMLALKNEGLVDALCGGQCACATCHIYLLDDWVSRVGSAEGQEQDMLETSMETRDTSRLSCQVLVTDGMGGLAIEIAPEEG